MVSGQRAAPGSPLRTLSRRKAPARWAVAAGTTVAMAGFWAAVVAGPKPAPAAPLAPVVPAAAPGSRPDSTPPAANTRSARSPAPTQPPAAVAPVQPPPRAQPTPAPQAPAAARPRLRTRGS
jgi:hypothetical protein